MKRRHKRIGIILAGVAGLSLAAFLALSAFQNNLVFFFSPTQVAAKEAPVNRTFRIGGLVEEGTLKRDERWFDRALHRHRHSDEHSRGLQRHTSRSF